MGHFEDAHELVVYSREALNRIGTAYTESLNQKTIKPRLLIEIKNLTENLRSALDYSAHGLYSRYGSSTKKNPKIYFPYATESQDEAEFVSSNRIENSIPGLTAGNPEAVAKLLSFQHFAGPEWAWLPRFMKLNNGNKHQQLTPQTRREDKELRLSSGEASISLGPGASISMGPGTSIQIGGMSVPGGQVIGPKQPAHAIGGTQEVITWVSFRFSSNGEPVLDFLRQTLKGVDRIVDELSTV